MHVNVLSVIIIIIFSSQIAAINFIKLPYILSKIGKNILLQFKKARLSTKHATEVTFTPRQYKMSDDYIHVTATSSST